MKKRDSKPKATNSQFDEKQKQKKGEICHSHVKL